MIILGAYSIVLVLATIVLAMYGRWSSRGPYTIKRKIILESVYGDMGIQINTLLHDNEHGTWNVKGFDNTPSLRYDLLLMRHNQVTGRTDTYIFSIPYEDVVHTNIVGVFNTLGIFKSMCGADV